MIYPIYFVLMKNLVGFSCPLTGLIVHCICSLLCVNDCISIDMLRLFSNYYYLFLFFGACSGRSTVKLVEFFSNLRKVPWCSSPPRVCS